MARAKKTDGGFVALLVVGAVSVVAGVFYWWKQKQQPQDEDEDVPATAGLQIAGDAPVVKKATLGVIPTQQPGTIDL